MAVVAGAVFTFGVAAVDHVSERLMIARISLSFTFCRPGC